MFVVKTICCNLAQKENALYWKITETTGPLHLNVTAASSAAPITVVEISLRLECDQTLKEIWDAPADKFALKTYAHYGGSAWRFQIRETEGVRAGGGAAADKS